MHTAAVRLAAAALRAIHSTSAASSAARSQPAPPATISVSMSRGASRTAASGTSVKPLELRSGAPSRLTIAIS